MKKRILVFIVLAFISCNRSKLLLHQFDWKTVVEFQQRTLIMFYLTAPPFLTILPNDSIKIPKGLEKYEKNKKFKWAILKVKFVDIGITELEMKKLSIYARNYNERYCFYSNVKYVAYPYCGGFEKKIKRWYEKGQIFYVDAGTNIIYSNEVPYLIFSTTLLEENHLFSDKLIRNF